MQCVLAANGAMVLSCAESMQKKYDLANDTFQVQDREAVVAQVLQLWFDRHQTLKEKPKAPRIQHIVVAASPGKLLFSLFDLIYFKTSVLCA